MAGGRVLRVALVRHEINRPAPIIPFDLLRIRLFSLSVATSIASFMAQMAGLVALPFEIQRLGRSAVETGLLMTPWPVAVAVAAPIAGRLADRYPAGILGSLGLVSLSAGLSLLALFPARRYGRPTSSGAWRCAEWVSACSSHPTTAHCWPPRHVRASGAAGGMLGTARLLGQTLGAAGVAILFRALPGTGSNRVLWVAAGVALVAALISVSRLAPRPSA